MDSKTTIQHNILMQLENSINANVWSLQCRNIREAH